MCDPRLVYLEDIPLAGPMLLSGTLSPQAKILNDEVEENHPAEDQDSKTFVLAHHGAAGEPVVLEAYSCRLEVATALRAVMRDCIDDEAVVGGPPGDHPGCCGESYRTCSRE